MNPLLKIEAVDKTSLWRAVDSKIKSVITKRIDTATLIFDDPITITEWDEVIISNQGETVRYFAGFITLIQPDVVGIDVVWKCRAQDYTVLLDKTIASDIYEGMTDKEIIIDAFTTYLPEVTTATYIEESVTFDRLVANRWTLRRLLDTLSASSGFDWYVDYDKKLHYFAKETNAAPFGLSTSPDGSTTYPFKMKSYKSDATKIINRVIVEGGTFLSGDTDWEFPANGTQVNVQIDYRFWPQDGDTIIDVFINTGTDGVPIWTEKTVGVDNVDDLTSYNVLHNRDEKLLRFAAGHKPSNLDRAVKLSGRSLARVILSTDSDASFAKYNRWFEDKIQDESIESLAVAEQAGKAVLAEFAFAREQGVAEITEDGLASGMLIPLVDSVRGLNDNYLIHSLTTRFKGGQLAIYDIQFGEYNPDLIDIILSLKRAATAPLQQSDDEVLHKLIEMVLDRVGVEDADTTLTTHLTEAYKWGVDADELVWSFSTWK